MCHFPPGLAYLEVSTNDGWIICSQGVAGSPCAARRRWAICRSKSACEKNLDRPVVAPRGGGLLGPAEMVGFAEHAAASRDTASTGASALTRRCMGLPPSGVAPIRSVQFARTAPAKEILPALEGSTAERPTPDAER